MTVEALSIGGNVGGGGGGDFTKGIEMGCKRGRLLASRAVPPAQTILSLPTLATSDGGVQGCLLITGKHDPSSPSDAFKPRPRPATRRGAPSRSYTTEKLRYAIRHISCSFISPLPLAAAHCCLLDQTCAAIDRRDNYCHDHRESSSTSLITPRL